MLTIKRIRSYLFSGSLCLMSGLGALSNASAAPTEQTAVFAGGCFWGVDAVFKHVKGVSEVVSGYAGGNAATAHYEQVSNGDTGHAESVLSSRGASPELPCIAPLPALHSFQRHAQVGSIA